MQTTLSDTLADTFLETSPDTVSDTLPDSLDKQRAASSLYYSTAFSVLSPISAIGVLVLLNHFLIQQ